jgi:prepilin-type processing-associated H-X9-DG protein
LIELLVVMAIIGILIGLLLVAVQASRKNARLITCQSNMRQWTLAMLNYVQAHQGYLPRRSQGAQVTTSYFRPDDWFNALPPFMENQPLMTLLNANQPPQPGDRSVWMCPEMEEKVIPPTTPPSDQTADPSKMYFAYGMNMWLSTEKSLKPDHIDKVGPRTTLVFMSEGNGVHCSVLPSPLTLIAGNYLNFSTVARHSDMVNLAFLDGRIQAYSSDYVGCGVGIPDRPDIRWMVPDSPWTGP